MAKKPTFSNSKIDAKIAATPAAKAASPVASTPVRNSSIPKPKAAKPVVTYDMIAKRAYEIHLSGTGGSQDDNWHRAERELRGL